jgi:hypothetical protein
MKPILMSLIMSLALVTGVLAGTVNNPSMARQSHIWISPRAPDVMLPSPCGVGAMRAIVASAQSVDSPRAPGGASLVDYQCAGNSRPRVHSAPRSSGR